MPCIWLKMKEKDERERERKQEGRRVERDRREKLPLWTVSLGEASVDSLGGLAERFHAHWIDAHRRPRETPKTRVLVPQASRAGTASLQDPLEASGSGL